MGTPAVLRPRAQASPQPPQGLHGPPAPPTRLWVPGSRGDTATPAGSSLAGPCGTQHGARAWSRGPAPHCLVPVRHRGWPLGDSEAPRCERHLAPGGRAWAWSCQASKGSHGNRGAGSSKPRGRGPLGWTVAGCSPDQVTPSFSDVRRPVARGPRRAATGTVRAHRCPRGRRQQQTAAAASPQVGRHTPALGPSTPGGQLRGAPAERAGSGVRGQHAAWGQLGRPSTCPQGRKNPQRRAWQGQDGGQSESPGEQADPWTSQIQVLCPATPAVRSPRGPPPPRRPG